MSAQITAPLLTRVAQLEEQNAALRSALAGIMDYAITGAHVRDVDTKEQPQFVNAYAAIAEAA